MSGKIIGRLLLAAATCCLGACTSVDLNQPAPVVDSVPAKPVNQVGDLQPANAPAPSAAPASAAPADAGTVPEAVALPVVAPEKPPVRIALLLPAKAEGLAQVADAVRKGFMAAYQHEPGNIAVNVVETTDASQDVLAAYRQAEQDNDIVVGPLTRSSAVSIAQSQAVTKPTIALTQVAAYGEPPVAVPADMLPIGLSLEDEAGQVADWTSRKPVNTAFVISTDVAWQRRVAGAFAAQWQARGLKAEVMQLNMSGGYLDANGLLDLKKRVQQENPSLIFVALDAAETQQLRAAIGDGVDMAGTSQVNPYTVAAWASAAPLTSMNGVQLVDMPWQLQPDQAAVMVYPRLQQDPNQPHSADIARLYALGIDAYRVASEVAADQTDFELDGVTGKLSVHFNLKDPARFTRVEQEAAYVNGKVQPLQTR